MPKISTDKHLNAVSSNRIWNTFSILRLNIILTNLPFLFPSMILHIFLPTFLEFKHVFLPTFNAKLHIFCNYVAPKRTCLHSVKEI